MHKNFVHPKTQSMTGKSKGKGDAADHAVVPKGKGKGKGEKAGGKWN